MKPKTPKYEYRLALKAYNNALTAKVAALHGLEYAARRLLEAELAVDAQRTNRVPK